MVPDETHCLDLRADIRAGPGVKDLFCQQGKDGEKMGKLEWGVY